MIHDLWYKRAIVYSLHAGTFMDSNGDGIGDFEGLMRRLDYLAGLGVNCLWLNSFQKAPRRDDGYDISDDYQSTRALARCFATTTAGPTASPRTPRKAWCSPACMGSLLDRRAPSGREAK